ncbi:MAG: DUF192 domain-containing protein [Bauldia sp.]
MTRTASASVFRGRFLLASILAAVLIAPIGAGVLAQPTPAPAAAAEERPAEITIHTVGGDHVFTVEWALTPTERQRGLMYRPEMAADHGMVFDFFVEAPVSFWMANTLIPLDMIFIREDGTVFSIAKNTTPLSLDGVPSGGPVRYVLEVNGGTADLIGLQPGDRIDLQ